MMGATAPRPVHSYSFTNLCFGGGRRSPPPRTLPGMIRPCVYILLLYRYSVYMLGSSINDVHISGGGGWSERDNVSYYRAYFKKSVTGGGGGQKNAINMWTSF